MAEDAEGLHRNWGGGGCEMLWGQPPVRVRPWARLWVRGSAAQGLPGALVQQHTPLLPRSHSGTCLRNAAGCIKGPREALLTHIKDGGPS